MAAAVAVVAGTAAAAAVGLGLELPARGGEERRALGLKVCPPWVFTLVGQEKEMRWKGGLQNGKGDLKSKG